MILAVEILAILVLMAFSGFFSGSESAFAAANLVRLNRYVEERPGKQSKFAVFIKERYDDALIAILLGNNLVNIASSSLATVIAISLLGEKYAWVATAAMTVLILIFGEITPKIIATQEPDGTARILSVPLHAFMVIFTPFTKAAGYLVGCVSKLWKKNVDDSPAVTQDDLEIIIENAEDEGVIDEDRSDLLQSALGFDDVLAYEVLTPRVDMVSLDIDEITKDELRRVIASGYSRIPVYQDSVDNIIGILHINHLLRKCLDGSAIEDIDIKKLLMPVRFVHRAMPLPDVLTEMKKYNSHMVVVTDEYGGTMGVLTMEDVLEQLVGEIWDETDEIETEFAMVDENTYEADGNMRLADLFDELELDDKELDFENTTIGGWAIEMLNEYPHEGDSFQYRNLTIIVTKTQNMRVRHLRIVVDPEKTDSEETDSED